MPAPPVRHWFSISLAVAVLAALPISTTACFQRPASDAGVSSDADAGDSDAGEASDGGRWCTPFGEPLEWHTFPFHMLSSAQLFPLDGGRWLLGYNSGADLITPVIVDADLRPVTIERSGRAWPTEFYPGEVVLRVVDTGEGLALLRLSARPLADGGMGSILYLVHLDADGVPEQASGSVDPAWSPVAVLDNFRIGSAQGQSPAPWTTVAAERRDGGWTVLASVRPIDDPVQGYSTVRLDTDEEGHGPMQAVWPGFMLASAPADGGWVLLEGEQTGFFSGPGSVQRLFLGRDGTVVRQSALQGVFPPSCTLSKSTSPSLDTFCARGDGALGRFDADGGALGAWANAASYSVAGRVLVRWGTLSEARVSEWFDLAGNAHATLSKPAPCSSGVARLVADTPDSFLALVVGGSESGSVSCETVSVARVCAPR